MKNYIAKVINIKKMAPQVMCVKLKLIEKIDFQAGQYIIVKIPKYDIYRAYSFFSLPDTDEIELCIQLIEGGRASKYFAELKEGESVEFKGPLGSFILEQASEYVFVATGAGLAPLWVMIRQLLRGGYKKPVHLYFGRRYERELFMLNEIRGLSEKHANFTYTISVTRPTSDWRGETGRLTEHLAKLKNHKNKKFYICGGTDMVNDCQTILKEKGVATKDIHFERFH